MFDDLFVKHPRERLEIRTTVYESFEKEGYIKRKDLNGTCKFFYAIHQVLLLHQGPLREFTISMDADETCTEVDQIITYLSRNNTIKKLTLDLNFGYRLPSSVFMMLNQLTDLFLQNCTFAPKQKGFLSLTSVYLYNVRTSVSGLSRFLSNSPKLKSFTLLTEMNNEYETLEYDNSIYELFKYLPVVESLSLCMWLIRAYYYNEDEVELPRQLPSALVHLKYLFLDDICFFEKSGLPFLVLLIRSSPNLEKLKLEIYKHGDEIDPATLHNDPDLWLEHLNELEIVCFSYLKHELEFLKFVLVKSPVLKKVSLVLVPWADDDEELKIPRLLVSAPRASPMVEIILKQHPHKR